MWLLDTMTTAGAFVLLLIGLVLLSRSGPVSEPTSGAHWIGIAIIFFVAARLLHIPLAENYFDALPLGVDASNRWYNLPYLLTIISTTLALGYCIPATAWVVGHHFNPLAAHGLAGLSTLVLSGAFATSDLWRRPIGYLPDSFDWSVSQSIFWAYVAAAIALVGVVALLLIARTLSEFAGAIRLMMTLIGSASIVALLFSLHILFRVFGYHMAPQLFPGFYVRNSSFIAVSLTTVVTVLLVAALLVPQSVKLRDRLHRYRLLVTRSEDWTRTRQVMHRNVFGDIAVPITRTQCWAASATPVVTHRMMFEITERLSPPRTSR